MDYANCMPCICLPVVTRDLNKNVYLFIVCNFVLNININL